MRPELHTKHRDHRRTFFTRNVTRWRLSPLIRIVPCRLDDTRLRRQLPDQFVRIHGFVRDHLKRVATASIRTGAVNFTFVEWPPGHGPRRSLMQLNVSLQVPTVHVFANWLQLRMSSLFTLIRGRANAASVAPAKGAKGGRHTSNPHERPVGPGNSFFSLHHTLVHLAFSLGRTPAPQQPYGRPVREEAPSQRYFYRQQLHRGRAHDRSVAPTDSGSIVVQPPPNPCRFLIQQLTVMTRSSYLHRQHHHHYPGRRVRHGHRSISVDSGLQTASIYSLNHWDRALPLARMPVADALAISTSATSVTRSHTPQTTARWFLLHAWVSHAGHGRVEPGPHTRPGVVETTMPMVARLVSRLSITEQEIQQTSSSRVFARQTQVVSSTFRSENQIATDEEVRKHVQRLLQEETTRLEKRLRAKTPSAEEMTDRVYNHLTRRLQIDRERLGY